MRELRDLDALGPETLRAFFYGERRFRERPHAEVSWRAPGAPGEAENVRILTGYPAIFNQVTTLYDGRSFCMQEQIDPGFFDDVLENDCHLTLSHESESAMCRNNPCMPAEMQGGPGSMELSVDAHGLRVFARVPMDDMDAMRMAPKMDRGVVDQMSFAFSVAQEECLQTVGEDGRDLYLYTLVKCARLYDVCVAPLGAYSQTEAMLRSVFAVQLGDRSPEGPPDVPVRSEEGQEDGEGRATAGLQVARSVLLAEGTVALRRFRRKEQRS